MIPNTPEAWDERAKDSSSWSAAMWSENGQTQRFVAALRHLNLRDGDTVLDYGCGTGRFSEFLPPAVTYYAYDTSPGMRERAREHERAWVLDELPDVEFDHVVCIGTFNLADNWTKDATWEALEGLWAFHTRRTLVASLYRGDHPDCLSYSVEEVAEFGNYVAQGKFLLDGTHLDNDLMLVLRG